MHQGVPYLLGHVSSCDGVMTRVQEGISPRFREGSMGKAS